MRGVSRQRNRTDWRKRTAFGTACLVLVLAAGMIGCNNTPDAGGTSGAGAGGASGASEANNVKRLNVESLSNLKQLGLGLNMYVQDHNEQFPQMSDAATLKQTIFPYVKNEELFHRADTKEPYRPNPSLSGKYLNGIGNVASVVSIYEASAAPDGTRAVVFVDGHARRLPETEWPSLKQTSNIP